VRALSIDLIGYSSAGIRDLPSERDGVTQFVPVTPELRDSYRIPRAMASKHTSDLAVGHLSFGRNEAMSTCLRVRDHAYLWQIFIKNFQTRCPRMIAIQKYNLMITEET
jgi:hypothetical protein